MTGVTGLDMLIAQAKYAAEFYLDRELDEALIPRTASLLTF